MAGWRKSSGYASSVRFGLRLWAEAAAAVHIPASPAGSGRGSSSHRAGGDYREDRFCVMPDLRPAVLRYGERSQAAAAYTDAAADSAPVRRTQLHDLPQIHHCHPVAHVPDHRDVVRDQYVGQISLLLQGNQQIEDLRRTEISSALVGSSSTMMSGSEESARAIAMRWRCPPETHAAGGQDILLECPPAAPASEPADDAPVRCGVAVSTPAR